MQICPSILNSLKRTLPPFLNKLVLNPTSHGSNSPKTPPLLSTPSTPSQNGSVSSDKCNTKISSKPVRSLSYSVKKLKSLDIPDSIESVKSKKLPKEVLKPIIPRFKLENDKLELVDSKEKLRE